MSTARDGWDKRSTYTFSFIFPSVSITSQLQGLTQPSSTLIEKHSLLQNDAVNQHPRGQPVKLNDLFEHQHKPNHVQGS